MLKPMASFACINRRCVLVRMFANASTKKGVSMMQAAATQSRARTNKQLVGNDLRVVNGEQIQDAAHAEFDLFALRDEAV